MQPFARSLLIGAALGAGGLTLGGCGGFTPLYAVPGVSPKLAAISVSRPEGRTGFLLGQYLDDELAHNREQPALYRLSLKSREVRVPRGIRIDNVASRYEVELSTTWTLTEIATSKEITHGQVQTNVTYDSADQPYAAIAASEDGEERAASQVAMRIRVALSAYFASPPPNAGAQVAATDPNTNAATYSERLQPAVVLSPRERALGQPTSQGGQADIFGMPLQSTTTPDTEPKTFSPSQDPNPIQTLPQTSGQ